MKPTTLTLKQLRLGFPKPKAPEGYRLHSGRSVRTTSVSSLRPGGILVGIIGSSYVIQNSATLMKVECQEIRIFGSHSAEVLTYSEVCAEFREYIAPDQQTFLQRLRYKLFFQ